MDLKKKKVLQILLHTFVKFLYRNMLFSSGRYINFIACSSPYSYNTRSKFSDLKTHVRVSY